MGVEFENLDKPIKTAGKKNKSWLLYGALGVGLFVLYQNSKGGSNTSTSEDNVTTAEGYALLQSAEQSILSQVSGKLSGIESQFSQQLNDSMTSLIDSQEEQFGYMKDEYDKQLQDMKTQLEQTSKNNTSAKTSTVYYYSEPSQSTPTTTTNKTDNQNKYLDNLIDTGSQGNKVWAMYEKDKLNGTNNAADYSQNTYLTNLAATGTTGQKAWAESELKKKG